MAFYGYKLHTLRTFLPFSTEVIVKIDCEISKEFLFHQMVFIILEKKISKQIFHSWLIHVLGTLEMTGCWFEGRVCEFLFTPLASCQLGFTDMKVYTVNQNWQFHSEIIGKNQNLRAWHHHFFLRPFMY
jgi:hypothetical protein